MKFTLDFKARQCQLRTVCRRFSPKKRNKRGQKNQKGRSLKRTVLKPSANLWFLIISYNTSVYTVGTHLLFVLFFYFCFPEHKRNRRKFIEEKTSFKALNLAPPSKNCPSIFLNTCFGAKNENFMKFHILFVKYTTVYTFLACVMKEREITHEAMITFTMCSERVLA